MPHNFSVIKKASCLRIVSTAFVSYNENRIGLSWSQNRHATLLSRQPVFKDRTLIV